MFARYPRRQLQIPVREAASLNPGLFCIVRARHHSSRIHKTVCNDIHRTELAHSELSLFLYAIARSSDLR